MIIGITGKAGSGKDLAAGIIKQHWQPAVIIRFSDHLKNLVSLATDIDPALMNLQVEKSKVLENPAFGGDTLRDALVKVGLAVRDVYPDFWVACAMNMIPDTHDYGGDVLSIFPDVRFRNEAREIKRRGGLILRIHRPGLPDGDNVSETEMNDIVADLEYLNYGTPADLARGIIEDLTRLLG